MRGIVFTGKGKTELWDNLEAPALGRDELQLKTLYSAVSTGTERHVLLGGPYASRFPVIAGYQTVSEVSEVGADAEGFAVGDIVYSDGGSEPANFDGVCWGGHLEVRNRSTEGNIIKVPASIPLEDASLLGVMGVGMKAAKRGGVSIHDRVLIIGLGLIGQACAQAAAAMGASVEGIDLDTDRRELAAELSCRRVWDGAGEGVWDALRAGGGVDGIFETTGADGMPDRAIQSLVPSTGRMVAIGGKFEMKYDNLSSGQQYEATVVHTSHFGLADLEDLVRLMREDKIRTGEMITNRLPVSEAPAMFDKIAVNPAGFLGIVFDWRV